MKYMTEDQVTHIYQAILAQVPRAVAAETAGPLTAALESLRQLKDDDSDLFSVAVVDNGFSAAADELASAAKASPQAIAVLIRILKKLPGETPFYYYVRQGAARALGLLADRLGDVSELAANALAAHLDHPPDAEASTALRRLIRVDPRRPGGALLRDLQGPVALGVWLYAAFPDAARSGRSQPLGRISTPCRPRGRHCPLGAKAADERCDRADTPRCDRGSQ